MAASDTAWLSFAILCEKLASTRGKLDKRAAMAEFLRASSDDDAGRAAQYLTGAVFPEVDERKLQVGGQTIVRALEKVTRIGDDRFSAIYRKYGDLGSAAEEMLLAAHGASRQLSLGEIAARLDSLAAARTQAAKSAQLVDVLRSLSPIEAKYFIKLVLGDMRTGVKQSLVEEAIAAAAEEELRAVRHAEMLLGDLRAVVELARRHELSAARFQMFHPLGFMLATPAASAKEAYAHFAGSDERPAAQIEDKYDGMRAQIHCGDPGQPGRVRIFSRNREDVTASFPELAEWFCGAGRPAILDGEILAWDFDADRALPFTALQQRLGRKRVTAALRVQAPVAYLAFDLLLSGDELLLDAPLQERRARLEEWSVGVFHSATTQTAKINHAYPQGLLFETDTVAYSDRDRVKLKLAPIAEMISPQQIEEAFASAQARGNEGLMLKSLASTYQPGKRGSAWMKLKRELATLDVVVTVVEYGHGRRANVLSDYTFAVREGDGLRSVGKAYSGLTDEEISTMTRWFLAHTLSPRPSNHSRLTVEPKIVLEVAFNNVMQSDRHDSGYALRFPRIVRLRPDKPPEEIDTLERVAEIFHSQHKKPL